MAVIILGITFDRKFTCLKILNLSKLGTLESAFMSIYAYITHFKIYLFWIYTKSTAVF